MSEKHPASPARESRVSDELTAQEALDRAIEYFSQRKTTDWWEYTDETRDVIAAGLRRLRSTRSQTAQASASESATPQIKVAAPCSEDLWNEIIEFLEDHEDVVDGAYGESMPNEAMRILNRLREGRG